MSRSELAQSIDESTQGKVTHRQGDFNRKLGNEGAVERQIKTLITLAYSREDDTDHYLRMFLGSRDVVHASTRSLGLTAAQQAAPAR
jgi:hypothetical protein